MMNLLAVSSIDAVCILWIIFHMRPKESIYNGLNFYGQCGRTIKQNENIHRKLK